MNKKGKILIAILIAIALIVATVLICIHESTSDPLLPPQETTPQQNQFIRTSTKPWANKAWLERINAEDIKHIIFVDKRNEVEADTAWSFDGISFYFKTDTLYIAVGNYLRVTGAMNGAFSDLVNLETIEGFDRIDTSEVADMSRMFQGCTSLATLSVKDIETDSVVLASSMFKECSSLKELDMSELNMENALDMSGMFYGCTSLSKIALPKTRDVLYLNNFFRSVGLSSGFGTTITGTLNTSNCEDMSYMFQYTMCNSYDIVESFDTSSLKNVEGMFYECSIEQIDLSKWYTKNLENAKHMFWSASSMKSCNTDGWDVGSLKSCEGMFFRCTGLRDLKMNWVNVDHIQNTSYMFQYCFSMKIIDVTCFDGAHFGNAQAMFYGDEYTEIIYSNGFKADAADEMFMHCVKLKNYSNYYTDLMYAEEREYFTPKATNSPAN